MRIVCVSDTHGVLPLPEIPVCDLLLVAGDNEPKGYPHADLAGRRAYLEGPFAAWLAAVPARHKVGIAGNHDYYTERDPALLRSLPWHYLQDETVFLDGVWVHGTPWTSNSRPGAFRLPTCDLARKWTLSRKTATSCFLMRHPMGTAT
jgi:hypothetical protein